MRLSEICVQRPVFAFMLILFLVLILDHPAWYFLAEVTFLNLVLAYALKRQNQLCRRFLAEIENLAQ